MDAETLERIKRHRRETAALLAETAALLEQMRADEAAFTIATRIKLLPIRHVCGVGWTHRKPCTRNRPPYAHTCNGPFPIWDHARRAYAPDGRRAVVLAAYSVSDGATARFADWCDQQDLAWRLLPVAHHNPAGCTGILVTARP